VALKDEDDTKIYLMKSYSIFWFCYYLALLFNLSRYLNTRQWRNEPFMVFESSCFLFAQAKTKLEVLKSDFEHEKERYEHR